MKRIAIIGCAGSGKTTLALRLKKILQLPVVHLDKYFWKPNWQIVDFDEFLDKHYQLCDESEWIIDGMYYRALHYRLDRADTIIFLDFSRFTCLRRVLTRLLKNFGKVTESSAEQCPERFEWRFYSWIWHFNTRFRKDILMQLKHLYADKAVYVITSNAQLTEFIRWLDTAVSQRD